METEERCPECGASWQDGATCTDHFHQMLFWEAADPDGAVQVHPLMVLSYHLQHPSLYSPEGLTHARGLLDDFIERELSPQEVRARQKSKVDSTHRKWKITGRPGSRGSYPHPVAWKMTAADVVAAGSERYCDSVRAWARSIHESPAAE